MASICQHPFRFASKGSTTKQFRDQQKIFKSFRNKAKASHLVISAKIEVDQPSEVPVSLRRRALIGLTTVFVSSGGIALARSRAEGRLVVEEKLTSIAETTKQESYASETAPSLETTVLKPEPVPQEAQPVEVEAVTLEAVQVDQPTDAGEKVSTSASADPMIVDAVPAAPPAEVLSDPLVVQTPAVQPVIVQEIAPPEAEVMVQEAPVEPVAPVVEADAAGGAPISPEESGDSGSVVGVAVGLLGVAGLASFVGRKLFFGNEEGDPLNESPSAPITKSSTDIPPSPTPLSPYSLYPDLKPPVSPTPKPPAEDPPAAES